MIDSRHALRKREAILHERVSGRCGSGVIRAVHCIMSRLVAPIAGYAFVCDAIGAWGYAGTLRKGHAWRYFPGY
jgi:hypothetical protein